MMRWTVRLEGTADRPLPDPCPCWKIWGPKARAKKEAKCPSCPRNEIVKPGRKNVSKPLFGKTELFGDWLCLLFSFSIWLKSDNYAVGSRNKGDSWMRIIVDVMVLWLSESGLNFLLPWKWKKIRGNWRDMRGVSELWWLEKIEKGWCGDDWADKKYIKIFDFVHKNMILTLCNLFMWIIL